MCINLLAAVAAQEVNCNFVLFLLILVSAINFNAGLKNFQAKTQYWASFDPSVNCELIARFNHGLISLHIYQCAQCVLWEVGLISHSFYRMKLHLNITNCKNSEVFCEQIRRLPKYLITKLVMFKECYGGIFFFFF